MVKNLMKLGDFEKAHEILQIIEKKMAPTRSVLDFEGSILRRTEAGRRTEKNIDKMKKAHIYLFFKRKGGSGSLDRFIKSMKAFPFKGMLVIWGIFMLMGGCAFLRNALASIMKEAKARVHI